MEKALLEKEKERPWVSPNLNEGPSIPEAEVGSEGA